MTLQANDLPSGWEWTSDWVVDRSSVNNADGWVYDPDVESLKWPESFDPLKFVNHARQRKLIRKRKQVLGSKTPEISVGLLKPGNSLPLPLSGLTQYGLYVLQLRPSSTNNIDEFAWSAVVNKLSQSEVYEGQEGTSELCVSTLTESEELLYCTQITGTSSSDPHRLWFSVSIQSTEIAKDIHSDPIQDWNLVVKAPLSISNYLPLTAEYSVLEMKASGHFVACCRGIFCPGKTVKIHNGDIRNPLFLSLLPQRGWLPINVRNEMCLHLCYFQSTLTCFGFSYSDFL